MINPDGSIEDRVHQTQSSNTKTRVVDVTESRSGIASAVTTAQRAITAVVIGGALLASTVTASGIRFGSVEPAARRAYVHSAIDTSVEPSPDVSTGTTERHTPMTNDSSSRSVGFRIEPSAIEVLVPWTFHRARSVADQIHALASEHHIDLQEVTVSGFSSYEDPWRELIVTAIVRATDEAANAYWDAVARVAFDLNRQPRPRRAAKADIQISVEVRWIA